VSGDLHGDGTWDSSALQVPNRCTTKIVEGGARHSRVLAYGIPSPTKVIQVIIRQAMSEGRVGRMTVAKNKPLPLLPLFGSHSQVMRGSSLIFGGNGVSGINSRVLGTGARGYAHLKCYGRSPTRYVYPPARKIAQVNTLEDAAQLRWTALLQCIITAPGRSPVGSQA